MKHHHETDSDTSSGLRRRECHDPLVVSATASGEEGRSLMSFINLVADVNLSQRALFSSSLKSLTA